MTECDIEKLVYAKNRKRCLKDFSVESMSTEQLQDFFVQLDIMAQQDPFCFSVFKQVCAQIRNLKLIHKQFFAFVAHYYSSYLIIESLELLKLQPQFVELLIINIDKDNIGLCIVYFQLYNESQQLLQTLQQLQNNEFAVKAAVLLTKYIQVPKQEINFYQELVNDVLTKTELFQVLDRLQIIIQVIQSNQICLMSDEQLKVIKQRLISRQASGQGIKINVLLFQILVFSVEKDDTCCQNLLQLLNFEPIILHQSEYYQLFECILLNSHKIHLESIIYEFIFLLDKFKPETSRQFQLINKIIEKAPYTVISRDRLFRNQSFYQIYGYLYYQFVNKIEIPGTDEVLEALEMFEDEQVDRICQLLNQTKVAEFAKTVNSTLFYQLVYSCKLYSSFNTKLEEEFISQLNNFNSNNLNPKLFRIFSDQSVLINSQIIGAVNSFFINVQRTSQLINEDNIDIQKCILYAVQFLNNNLKSSNCEFNDQIVQIATNIQDFYLLRFKQLKFVLDQLTVQFVTNFNATQLNQFISRILFSLQSSYSQIRLNSQIALSRVLNIQFQFSLPKLFAEFKFVNSRESKFGILKSIQLASLTLNQTQLKQLLVFFNFAMKERDHSIREIGINIATNYLLNDNCSHKMKIHMLNYVHPNFTDDGFAQQVKKFVKAFDSLLIVKYLEIGLFATAKRVRDQYNDLYDQSNIPQLFLGRFRFEAEVTTGKKEMEWFGMEVADFGNEMEL
ncbi:Hypothetical_protein [Hexamita inflata]|uniref:Hypothetical_protein n=1 Tax=Hexamita inflata TaxID=28002 RepID=A0ABP1HZC7_9EUKA